VQLVDEKHFGGPDSDSLDRDKRLHGVCVCEIFHGFDVEGADTDLLGEIDQVGGLRSGGTERRDRVLAEAENAFRGRGVADGIPESVERTKATLVEICCPMM
jgi:hypothetical protein